MKISNRRDCDALCGQHAARKCTVVFLIHFLISVRAVPVKRQQVVPVVSNDIRDLMSDFSGKILNHADIGNVEQGEAEVQAEDDDRQLARGSDATGSDVRGSDVRGSDGSRRTSSGQCRVLSLADAAAVLARSASSQSITPASDDIQRYLTDLRQRLATRTVVLCKAVAAGNASPEVAPSANVLMSETPGEKNRQPPSTERPSDDLEERATALTGSRTFVAKARERPHTLTHFRSTDDGSSLSGSGAFHRLRHRRHRRRQDRHRKRIRASPFNRKYDGQQRSRRTPGGCGGRNVDGLDVERVAAIMKAFYCWDDDVAWLTNQMRQSGAHLLVTSSSAQLRCRLMRRYDECRDNFIDKVFRTGHGVPISWPRQIMDVMDRDDYSAVYY